MMYCCACGEHYPMMFPECPMCCARERDALQEENQRLRASLEVAIGIYENLREEAILKPSVIEEAFYEAHRDMAMIAIGTLDEAHAVADEALGRKARA